MTNARKNYDGEIVRRRFHSVDIVANERRVVAADD